MLLLPNKSRATRLLKWLGFSVVAILLTGTLACNSTTPYEDPLAQILDSEDPLIRRVMEDPKSYELQIRYTRILRSGDSVSFEEYDYGLDPLNYHYPASTVKFPVAVLALEKLHASERFHRKMSYYIEGDSVVQSFEDDIIQIFAVSDNHANNRLFEYLGQDAINDSLAAREVGPVRIAHRLGFHREDTATLPLIVQLNDSVSTQTTGSYNRPVVPLELSGILKGNGFMDGDSLRSEPFDFSYKNYLPVPSLNEILKRVIFPEAYPEELQFRIGPEQREFLLNAMQLTPREAGYDPEHYPDGYCKFFLYGDTETRIPDHIDIFNKVGFAYGTLTDCAYIRDRNNGVEFMLTASLLVNENGIFNDDQYEFDTVGIPFLAALGRAVHQYELKNPPKP